MNDNMRSIRLRHWISSFLLAASFLIPCQLFGEGSNPKAEIRAAHQGDVHDGSVTAFDAAFMSAPVVVASGQWRSEPWLAAAKDESSASFALAFCNPNAKGPVGDGTGTWVQYIAVVPDPASASLAAAKVAASDGATITFPKALSGVPAVICSAVDEAGTPLFSNPSDIGKRSFRIHLTDMNGDSARGKLSYIAAVPAATPLSIGNASLSAGSSSASAPGGADLVYGVVLSAEPTAVLCSSYLSGIATVSTTHTLRTDACFCGTKALSAGSYASLAGTASLWWMAVVK